MKSEREVFEYQMMLKVAAEAVADPRTVMKRMRGKKIRGHIADRIDAVLLKHGFRLPKSAS